MKKMKILLFIISAFIIFSSFANAGLWTNGDKGVTVINWRASDMLYTWGGGAAYVFIAITPYSPVPSWCSPTIEILGGPQLSGWNGTFSMVWNFYYMNNSWIDITLNPTTVGNTSTAFIQSSGLSLNASSWYYLFTKGIIAVYGSTCSGGNFEISGSLTQYYYTGTSNSVFMQKSVPLQFSNTKF